MRARTILVALAALPVAGCWDLSYELAGSGGSGGSPAATSVSGGPSTTGDPVGSGGSSSTAPSTTSGAGQTSAGQTSSASGSPGSGGAGGAPTGSGGDGGAPSPTTTGGEPSSTADATSTGSDASSTTTAASSTVTTGGSLDPDGTPCSSGQTCESGFCVDGVCCNEACDGPCLTCGGGPFTPGDAGQCTSYEQDDPEDECPDCQVCDLGLCSDPCVTMGQICCTIGQARCEQAQFCQ